MGKKSHVPEYSSATVNTGGLFGSAKADADGVNLNPTSWQKSLSKNVVKNLNPTINNMQNTLNSAQGILNSITSGDYLNDANFQAYQNDFNRRAKETFDTAVLGNLADRGLLRSSGLQALTDNYSNTMRNDLTNLMDNYYNRMANNYNLTANQYGLYNTNLGNLLNTENTLYNWLMGVGNMAQSQANAVSGYNAQKAQIENANNGNLFGQLMNAGATLGGGALGGVPGSVAGNWLSKVLTNNTGS